MISGTSNDFVATVNDCKGQVWLESPEGDRYNLKSVFSQYIALGKLLEERGDYLELFEYDRYHYEKEYTNDCKN